MICILAKICAFSINWFYDPKEQIIFLYEYEWRKIVLLINCSSIYEETKSYLQSIGRYHW